jgi:ABC-type transport system involved in Fe-S cluster assembly fused permease/ATPase subunit
MNLLLYMHAPIVAFYLIGAHTFELCVLQKPQPTSHKRRRGVLIFAAITLLAYITEVLHYLCHSLAEREYEPPKPATIRCLGSILTWSPLLYKIWSSKSVQWYSYFGTFVLHFACETTACLVSSFSIPAHDMQHDVTFVISCTRAVISLFLLVDAFAMSITKHMQEGLVEERQSLLTQPANGPEIGTAAADYGSITQIAPSDDEKGGHTDSDTEIKKIQAKRLEEEGGWLGYLKAFAVFLPDLFPTDDWIVICALFVRLLHMLQARVLNLLTPQQLGIIMNKISEPNPSMPWKNIRLWVLYNCIETCFITLDSYASFTITTAADRRIAQHAYEHIIGMSMDFHMSKDSSEVLKAAEQASSLTSLIETVLFSFCPVFLDLVVAIYYMTYGYDGYMTFIILFMGEAYVSIGWFSASFSQPKRRNYAEKQRIESSTVNEIVRNWPTVAYFNRTTFECKRYATKIANTIRAKNAYYFYDLGEYMTRDIILNFGFASCIMFSITQIVSGQKRVGNLVTFMMYWNTLVSPLHVVSSCKNISSSLINAERLFQILNTKPSVVDQDGAGDLMVKEGKVEFKDVEFAYGHQQAIVRGVNLQVEGGQTIAFVGETGGGKSTMLKLLLRLYDVTGGSIMIDGQDLRSVQQASLREALGLVPQDPVLFNQTIRQNIRYARLEATDAEIEDACRAAAIHDDIEGFPDKYNSKVGERGVRLSGGQLQRIGIARVLLKNPKILLLDEATSAIDSATEEKIQTALRKFSNGRTTIVIAHRLSTIMEADQILVMEKGKIIERGTHQELLGVSGKYSELWTKQTVGQLSAAHSKAPTKDEDGNST